MRISSSDFILCLKIATGFLAEQHFLKITFKSRLVSYVTENIRKL